MAIAGFAGGRLGKSFSKGSRITILLIVISITFVCELIAYLLQILLFKMQIEWIAFLKIIGIEIIYNSIIVIILYPLLQRVGNLIERAFTESKVLTRYF